MAWLMAAHAYLLRVVLGLAPLVIQHAAHDGLSASCFIRLAAPSALFDGLQHFVQQKECVPLILHSFLNARPLLMLCMLCGHSKPMF